MSATDLVPSVSVANMVNQRAAVVDRLERAFELIREASLIAAEAHVGMPRIELSNTYSRHGGGIPVAAYRLRTTSRSGDTFDGEARAAADLAKAMRLGIDAPAWQYLMHESGLRSLMDADARNKWDKSIHEGDVPELTEANVRSTFKMLHDSRADMFERGVLNVFKSLSWDYKTNLPQKFGKRIVLTYLHGTYGSERCDKVDDLVRVMSVIDGKPEPDYRNGTRAMLSRAGIGYSSPRGECENDYLAIRCFKNGNGHVTFKRPELVDSMNRIIAKHYPGALPAPR